MLHINIPHEFSFSLFYFFFCLFNINFILIFSKFCTFFFLKVRYTRHRLISINFNGIIKIFYIRKESIGGKKQKQQGRKKKKSSFVDFVKYKMKRMWKENQTLKVAEHFYFIPSKKIFRQDEEYNKDLLY